MKLAIGSDHAGFDVKNDVVRYCREAGHEVVDVGPTSADRVDYPDYARKVAQALTAGEVDRGILVCGSGIGMSIAANRFNGVRAVVAVQTLQASMARKHNDANVLCLGARFSGASMIESMIDAFLSTDFEGGRHAGRVAKLDAAIGDE